MMRPAIFMKMSPRDVEQLKRRSQLMNEYHIDMKKYSQDFRELSKLNSDILENNSYCSSQNIDNYPTHKSAEGETYAAASKHWVNVDPKMQDHRSIHYAAEDRTYLILKNKYTGEWQFPSKPMKFGESFTRSKQDLFSSLSGDKWRVRFSGLMPQQHSIRRFSEAEMEDPKNQGLKGVRTYFFYAHHYRGLTAWADDLGDKHDLIDHAWIPKRQMNEYLTKEYHEVFINGMVTR